LLLLHPLPTRRSSDLKLDASARDAARPVGLLDGHAYAVVRGDAVLSGVARERHEGPDANLLVRGPDDNVASLPPATADAKARDEDRKSIRLNSSHRTT